MAEETEVLERAPDEVSSAARRMTPLPEPMAPAEGPVGDASITGGMARIAAGKLGEETAAFAETEKRTEADRAYMADRMKAQGLEAEKLRPWNHEEEQKKFQHSPLEAFGSLGSVVGILASAFTRAPMENAFGASAAAMNAVKAGDDEGFKRAFESYKVNTDLVVKREAMIQNGFNDAAALMRTDMAAGTAKAQHIAQKYGDQQALFLLQNGMSKELFEMMSSRADATRKMAEANEKITQMTFQKNTFEQLKNDLPEDQKNNPTRLIALWNYAHGMNTTEEERYMQSWWSEHKGATIDQAATAAAKFKSDARASGIQTPDRMDAKEIERRTEQYKAEGMPPNEAYDKAAKEVRAIGAANKLSVDQAFMKKFYEDNPDADEADFTKAFGEFKKAQKNPTGAAGGGGNVNLTMDRQRAADVAKYREQLKGSIKEDGSAYTDDEIAKLAAQKDRELKMAAAAPSGNQLDKLKGMMDQTKYFEGHLDAAENLLVKHKALTGLGGKILRPTEALGNVFGSNETDRKQFEREILGAQELASRILTGSAGRPLAAEASKINGIVAGLQMGDTTANTLRAIHELRPLVKKIREDLASRKGEPLPAGATPAASPGGEWWKKDKPVGKRSEVVNEEEAVG